MGVGEEEEGVCGGKEGIGRGGGGRGSKEVEEEGVLAVAATRRRVLAINILNSNSINILNSNSINILNLVVFLVILVMNG